MIPLGKRISSREAPLFLITYGALVKRSLDAVNQAAKMGIDVEVLDSEPSARMTGRQLRRSESREGPGRL